MRYFGRVFIQFPNKDKDMLYTSNVQSFESEKDLVADIVQGGHLAALMDEIDPDFDGDAMYSQYEIYGEAENLPDNEEGDFFRDKALQLLPPDYFTWAGYIGSYGPRIITPDDLRAFLNRTMYPFSYKWTFNVQKHYTGNKQTIGITSSEHPAAPLLLKRKKTVNHI